MAKPSAAAFYSSNMWKRTREAYKAYRGGLCELCLEKGLYNPGEIVHHKVHVTSYTLSQPDILTDFSNLMLVCRDHHAEIHRKREKRWAVDEQGRITATT